MNDFELKLIRWAAQRRQKKNAPSLKSPTYVIMKMLEMSPDAPDPEEPNQPLPQKVRNWTNEDVYDADLLDKVYASELLPYLTKEIIRLYYIQRRSPKKIEQILELGRFTFQYHKDCALSDFKKLYDKTKY